jgi:hypothetical protein
MRLDSDFEQELEAALLDDVEQQLIGEFDNLVAGFVEAVHRNLRSYAAKHGYDVEETIESVQVPEVTRTNGKLTVRVGWESEQMSRWEFGTPPHTIEGDPLLSFVWEDNPKRGDDPPEWVREEFDQARDTSGQFQSGWRVFLPEVEVRGIPESRAIRDALNDLRRVLETTS